MKCELFGCPNITYRSLSIGPGTSSTLCKEHFTEFKRELMPEYPKQGEGEGMVQQNTEKNVVEINLGDVDIPRAGFLADLLQEWVTWTRAYSSMLEDVGGLNDLHQRTIGAVKKGGRDG